MSTQKYYSDADADQVMLEDDSGRIRLVGASLRDVHLVTGCIIAVLGSENTNGEFQIIDLKFPDLAPQPPRWSATPTKKSDDDEMTDAAPKKLAIVSGLAFAGNDATYALELSLLLEYLLGEALDPATQHEISTISRLVIAGNSISVPEGKLPHEEPPKPPPGKRTNKKYGYDASAYNPLPSQLLDNFLSEILPSMPVTLLPGARDPANVAFPQQPIHTAMFPGARAFGPDRPKGDGMPGWFDAVTNPWEGEIDGWRVLGTGGQNVDDVFKYVDSEDRLGMMEAMCRWRCSAPTAPDTLCTSPTIWH